MAERSLLHINRLEQFKEWLTAKGYTIQEPKGIYEVCRATNGTRTVIVFKKTDARQHLTVMQRDYGLVRQFLNETKRRK